MGMSLVFVIQLGTSYKIILRLSPMFEVVGDEESRQGFQLLRYGKHHAFFPFKAARDLHIAQHIQGNPWSGH